MLLKFTEVLYENPRFLAESRHGEGWERVRGMGAGAVVFVETVSRSRGVSAGVVTQIVPPKFFQSGMQLLAWPGAGRPARIRS